MKNKLETDRRKQNSLEKRMLIVGIMISGMFILLSFMSGGLIAESNIEESLSSQVQYFGLDEGEYETLEYYSDEDIIALDRLITQ